MLRLIMRVSTIVLMLVCAASLDHTGAHLAPTSHGSVAAEATSGYADLEGPPSSAVERVADVPHASGHPCELSSTAAHFGWTTTLFRACLSGPEHASRLGSPHDFLECRPQRSLLLMTCVCRT